MKLQRLSADLGVRWVQAFDPGPASTPFSTTGRTRRWPPTDEQFVDMLRAYRAWGGLARRSEFEANLEARSSMGPSVLSAWIADAVVFEFEWGGQSWIPRFQFLPAALTPRLDVFQVVRELRPAFDSAELAIWFARPNDLLRARRPVEMVDEEFAAVREAARFDRSVAG